MAKGRLIKMITLKDVFYKRDTKNILYDINLNIDNVDITIITGHNGAGKSTLLKIMSGIIKPTSGVIHTQIDILSNSSFVFQKPIFFRRSVRENIGYALYARDMPYTDNLINEYLTHFKLSHLSDVLAQNISLGEQQIISFIRAIITNPKIIFLDEPTSNLDRNYKEMINNKISEISKKTKIFMITQNDTETKMHTLNPIIIENGKCL